MEKRSKKTLTVEEAAQELGISRNSAYKAVSTGELPVIKIGRRILVAREAFDRMVKAGSQTDRSFSG